jgi:glycosyltransferase involved in cell wall biosynthesis
MASSQYRIAIVIGGVEFGGTTTFCYFLGKGLHSLGIPVEVFSFTHNHPMEEDFRSAGVVVHRENENTRIYEDRMESLYEKLAQFEPHAIFGVIGVEFYETFRYVPAGVLRVAMMHDHLQSLYDELPPYRPYYDCIVAVAASIRDHIVEHYPGIPCEYLQHGVFLNPPELVRQPNPDQPLRLLFFGRFDELSKRVSMFPEVWRGLHEAKLPFRWTIHGQGPQEAYLRERLAAGVQAGEIVFSKPVPHDQLGEIIRQHDVYLLTSRHEAGPLTLLEGMGYGLVPVCADIPCMLREVIKPDNGFRVEPTATEQYVAAISKLHQDRRLLEQMSRAARQTVEQDFSEVAMARRYLAFVQKHLPSPPKVTWPGHIKPQPIIHTRSARFRLPLRRVRRLAKRLKTLLPKPTAGS